VGQVLGTFVAPAMESHELKQPFIPVIATGPFYVRFPKTTNLLLLFSFLFAGFAFLVLEEGVQPETAVYTIAQIITTIGYGDAVQPSYYGQTFLTFYVLVGALIFTNLATDVFDAAIRRTEIRLDTTLAKLRVRLSGKKPKYPSKYLPVISSAIILALLTFTWVMFFSHYESCTCSYGKTLVPDCIEGPQCKETGGYQTDMHTALYVAMITFSTVGFGDQAPKSKLGRCLGSFFMIVGVAAFGHLVAEVFHLIDEHKSYHRKRSRCTREIFNKIDRDQTGRISRPEFVRYMLVRQGKVDIKALKQVDELFDELDRNGSGHLSFEEIEGMILD